jgi:integrase
LTEALALTADRVDLAAGVLVIESLKKRSTGIYRAVPVPPALLDALDLVHGVREPQSQRGKGRGVRLWPWSRVHIHRAFSHGRSCIPQCVQVGEVMNGHAR